MKKLLSKKNIVLLSGILTLACLIAVIKVYAADNSYSPSAALYENTDAFNSSSGKTETFSCGTQAGFLSLSGSIQHQGDYYGTTAYAATECINIAYDYTGVFQTGDPDKWNIVDSDEKNVDGTKLSKKIEKGTIVIQRSYDGRNWENACDPIYNCFDEKNDKVNLSYLYSIDSNDIRKGTYYRVLVLYEMKKRTGTESAVFGLSEKDVYVTKYYIEKYDFYVCYGANPVQMYNVMDRSTSVSNYGTVESGFMIDTNNTNVSLSVTRDSFTPVSALNYQSFFTPGRYSIVSTNPIGDSFTSVVTVSGGLETSAVTVARYVNREKDGYVVSSASGGTPLTSLRIGQNAGSAIKTSTVNSFSAYGITGNSVSLFLRLNEAGLNASGWYIESDDWGKKDKETVDGVHVGQIYTGALIVQKSSDGSNWENIDSGRYSNGIYTTDFFKNFNGTGDILIYSPDGTDVINGVYLRVLFAYEIENEAGKDDKRVVEEYKFYLCCNELDAVTIHNLTASETLNQAIGDADATTQDIYRSAESMTTGSVTVSGFRIDTSLNPTVTYTVTKNGNNIAIPDNATFTDTGRYEIKLSSAVGTTKTITIYIDRMTIEQTMNLYFGDGFIDGKRIYAEGFYPTFEAGYTSYHFEAVSDQYQPLYGQITNLTTQKTTTINAYRVEKNDEITEPGNYEVVLYNNPTFKTDYPSGDNKVITIHFTIIPEGSAPGPVLNRQTLEASVKNSRCGIYPIYYGLIMPSSTKGYITLAFANWNDARQYAYDYEQGMVEIQSDGSYRYSPSFEISTKDNYDSAWDLTEDLNHYAELAVHQLYFDQSNESTYITLSETDRVPDDNLRGLRLNRSIFVYAAGQQELLTDLDALPILNDVPSAYLIPGDNGQVTYVHTPFQFVQDKYGCDSYSVEIVDCSGEVYPIEYNKPVCEQLDELDCPTGIVTIKESTVYGDSTEYEAVYFANNDNTASIELACYQNGQQTNLTLSQYDPDDVIETGAFSIQQVSDELDPYNLILVTDPNGNVMSFAADRMIGGAWSDVGEYTISVINRVGNKFSFSINISESEYATITFQGIGTDGFESVILEKGDKNISLPVPERYGYEFAGYRDEDGTIYESEISQVTFSGSKVLSPIWNPVNVPVSVVDTEGNLLYTTEIAFDSLFELPKSGIAEGYIVTSWSMNGSILTEGRIQINDIAPITFVVTLVQDENYIPEGETSGGKHGKTLFVIFALALVGIGAGFVYKKKKCVSSNDEIDNETSVPNEEEVADNKSSEIVSDNTNNSISEVKNDQLELTDAVDDSTQNSNADDSVKDDGEKIDEANQE